MRNILYCLCLILSVAGCNQGVSPEEEKTRNNFGVEVTVNPRGTLYTVHPSKITIALSYRGNIPPINNPKFVSAKEASSFLSGDENVVAVDYNGVRKAYPLKILRWLFVVNDKFGDEPVLLSYDPLSTLGMAYKRTVMDHELYFKTSDKVYNSNPLLMDETKTLWSQYNGKAILGQLTGQKLEEINTHISTWEKWKTKFPDTQVLSINTGIDREYERNDYQNYYKATTLVFPIEHEDKRIPVKTIVYGIELDGKFKAYEESTLSAAGTITDTISNIPLELTLNSSGMVSAIRKDTNQPLTVRRSFWYAWATFHPGTDLHEVAK